MSQIGLHSLRNCHKLGNSYLETVPSAGSQLLGDSALHWVTLTSKDASNWDNLLPVRTAYGVSVALRYWLNLDETVFVICRNLHHIVLFQDTLNLLQNYSAKSTHSSLMFVTTVFNHIRPRVPILLHMRMQRLYRVVAYSHATTVHSCYPYILVQFLCSLKVLPLALLYCPSLLLDFGRTSKRGMI